MCKNCYLKDFVWITHFILHLSSIWALSPHQYRGDVVRPMIHVQRTNTEIVNGTKQDIIYKEVLAHIIEVWNIIIEVKLPTTKAIISFCITLDETSNKNYINSISPHWELPLFIQCQSPPPANTHLVHSTNLRLMSLMCSISPSLNAIELRCWVRVKAHRCSLAHRRTINDEWTFSQ